MKYYYVGYVGGDIFTSSPNLERVIEALDKWDEMYPKYMREHPVQIVCYRKSGEIIEWKSKK